MSLLLRRIQELTWESSVEPASTFKKFKAIQDPLHTNYQMHTLHKGVVYCKRRGQLKAA